MKGACGVVAIGVLPLVTRVTPKPLILSDVTRPRFSSTSTYLNGLYQNMYSYEVGSVGRFNLNLFLHYQFDLLHHASWLKALLLPGDRIPGWRSWGDLRPQPTEDLQVQSHVWSHCWTNQISLHCRFITKLVPKLSPKHECTIVPQVNNIFLWIFSNQQPPWLKKKRKKLFYSQEVCNLRFSSPRQVPQDLATR